MIADDLGGAVLYEDYVAKLAVTVLQYDQTSLRHTLSQAVTAVV